MPDKIISDAILTSGSWRRLSERARVLFPAPLLAYTDEWGLASADLDSLHSLHPGLPWSDQDLLAVLEELVREGVLELYLAEGRWYLNLVHHDKYQRRWLGLRQHHGGSRHPPPKVPANTESALRCADEYIASCTRARAHGSAGGSRAVAGSSGELKPAEQLHTEASYAARAALPDFNLEETGAEIERRLDAQSVPPGELGRLFEVLGDVPEDSATVIRSYFSGLSGEAIELARREILDYQPRRPAAYAVGIAKRLHAATAPPEDGAKLIEYGRTERSAASGPEDRS